MIIDSADAVTPAVLYALRNTPNERMRIVYASLTKHLHAFVRDVGLTQDELEAGVAFLAELGHYTNDVRNEMMQASDVFGVSSLVSLLHHPLSEVETAAAVMGPFYRAKPAPWCAPGESISRGVNEGTRLDVHGRCTSATGDPIVGAVVDVWQASPQGKYDNQDPTMPDLNFRGKFRSDKDGRYHLSTLRPAGYPVPTDGPIGVLLENQARHAFRPAHIHFIVSAAGYETLITQLYVDEEKALEEDVVFGVTPPLVAEARPTLQVGGNSDPGGHEVEFDIALKPGESVLPTPPIP